MSFSLIIAEIGLILVVLTISYLKWSYGYWKKKNVPYLEPSIPFGNFMSPFRRNLPIGFEVHELYKVAKAQGWKHCGIYMMATPIYFVMDLEICKVILTKDFSHFTDRGIYYNEKDDPISAHLFAIGGTKWKNLRSKLTPTFTSGKMKSMFPTLNACRESLEKFMDEEILKGESIDIKSILSKYSTDIIGSCAFGIECNSFNDPNSPFIQYGRKVFQGSSLENFIAVFGISYPNVAKFLRFRAVPKDVSNFFYKTVESTIRYRKQNNIVRPDFLQLLIEIMRTKEGFDTKGDGQGLTMDETVAQCFVFFIAGFETSSSTMTFTLFELARHPEIQEKVRVEISQVLKKYKNEITYESLREMKYLRLVIDETLRMYPPVPFVTRTCVEDWKVPDSDTVITKGTNVFVSIKGFHYDNEYYNEPETFSPERFNEENRPNIHPYSYIPFGEGPRICIGLRFGIMQVMVGLTSILGKYRVRVSNKTKVPLQFSNYALVPTTDGGLWLDLDNL